MNWTAVETVGWWGLALIGVLGSALCSGVEMGCYTLNRVRLDIRAMRIPADLAARTLKGEIERPARLVSTILIGNNVFNYCGAIATTTLLEHAGASPAVILAVNLLILTPILLVIGESLPKELFRLEADRLTYLFARPLAFMRAVFTVVGVLPLVRAVARRAERLAGLRTQGEHLPDARQRMAMLLKEAGASGVLSESQATLVDRALAMRETTVEDEMVPWDQVARLLSDWDAPRVMQTVRGQARSRLPVIDRTGRVVGVVRLVDLYTRPGTPLTELLTEPARLEPELPVLEALRRLTLSAGRLGIVERNGRPVGLVTAKDLVEPLTGELPDW